MKFLMKWVPSRLTPGYWRGRWSSFAYADLPEPRMVVASPNATAADIVTVTEARGSLGKREIVIWVATWVVQALALAVALVQLMQLVSVINQDLQQCQSGHCGTSPIELSVLWLLGAVAVLFVAGRARRQLEQLFAGRAAMNARRARSAADRVIVVDVLDATSRWQIQRADHLLTAYPAVHDEVLWLLARRADAACRLNRMTKPDESLIAQLRESNDHDVNALEAAYDAKQPFRSTLQSRSTSRADVRQLKTINALLPSTEATTR